MIDLHTVLFGCVDLALYVAPLLFILFTVMDGRVDGIHFDRQQSPRQAFMKDVHVLFTWRRAAFMGVMFLSTGILTVLACALIFPALHDGEYYAMRHDLDPSVYPDAHRSEPSKTSTAIFDLSYRIRMIMAIIGLALIVVTIVLK